MPGLFGFMDLTKEGKGIPENQPPKGPVATFFAILGRKFWKIIQINLLYILFSIPAIVLSFFITPVLLNWLLPTISVETMTDLNIFICLTLVGMSLIAAGPVLAGVAFVLRSFAREESTFIWTDFKNQARKNIKQSLISSLISIIVMLILAADTYYISTSLSSNLYILQTLILGVITLAFVVWCVIQMYIYPMMVVFDLTLKQIYKNCLMLVIIRLPINIALLAGNILLMLGVPLIMFLTTGSLALLLVPIWYVFFAFGLNLYLNTFVVNRGLQKYMLDRLEQPE